MPRIATQGVTTVEYHTSLRVSDGAMDRWWTRFDNSAEVDVGQESENDAWLKHAFVIILECARDDHL